MDPIREIPQRELRNDAGRVLREVAAGRPYRITVDGRPVADLVPIEGRRRFVAQAEVDQILRSAPLDREFTADVAGALDEEIAAS